MKTPSSLRICAVIAAIAFTSGGAMANPVFPRGVNGSYFGTETISSDSSGVREINTLVRINQAAKNLQVVIRRDIDGRSITEQTVFRKNGVADYYYSVDGVVVASGFGRYSRRGGSLIGNFNVTDAFGTVPVRQRVALRGSRLSLIGADRSTGSNTVFFGDRSSAQ
jgi:hypothetical protein